MSTKNRHTEERAKHIKRLQANKVIIKTRVSDGEKLKDVAKELGVKVVQPL